VGLAAIAAVRAAGVSWGIKKVDVEFCLAAIHLP